MNIYLLLNLINSIGAILIAFYLNLNSQINFILPLGLYMSSFSLVCMIMIIITETEVSRK